MKKYIIVITLLILGVALAGIIYWNSSKNIPLTAENQPQQKTEDSILKIDNVDNNVATVVKPAKKEEQKEEQNTGRATAIIKTNFGDITLNLFDKDAPNTVSNFAKLSKSGFYDGVKFHRVIKGFMIQAGDPNSKDNNWLDDGMGGPGYAFPDEINSHKIVKGTIVMANAGPNTNGSQFFILTGESAPWLDGRHTVFGEIKEGINVAIKIESAETDKSRNDHPIQNIIIKTIEI